MKIWFEGHVISPRWIYLIQLAGDRRTEDVDFEGVMVGCELCDTMWLRVGKFKLPFLREELTSSKRQLAVERSFVDEFFTLNRAEQIQLETHWGDNIRLKGGINDGANSEFTSAGADPVEFSWGGRADLRLAGDLEADEGFHGVAGGGLRGVRGGRLASPTVGDANNPNDGWLGELGGLYFKWTVDGLVETNGLGIYTAVSGGHIE